MMFDMYRMAFYWLKNVGFDNIVLEKYNKNIIEFIYKKIKYVYLLKRCNSTIRLKPMSQTTINNPNTPSQPNQHAEATTQ